MPVISKRQREKASNGQERDVLSINFSNGALEQLKELREHFDMDDEKKVIEMGISVLQRLSESNTKKVATTNEAVNAKCHA